MRCAKYCYAECRSAECRYAECRSTLQPGLIFVYPSATGGIHKMSCSDASIILCAGMLISKKKTT